MEFPDVSANENIPINSINVKEEPNPINLLSEKKSKKRKSRSSVFRCEICFEEEFNDENLLKEHLESHSYQHKCYKCDAQFMITLDYIEHRQTHNKDEPYCCTLCTFTSKLLYKMKSHLQARHQEFKKYKCDVCSKRFHVSTHYMEHLSYHSGEKPFKCKLCSMTFMYSRDLNSHVKQKHVAGNFGCAHCQEEFEFKGDLIQHVKKHNRKACLCQVCGKMLSGPDKLKNHFRIHTGDKPYKCKFCEKSFPTSTRLTEHENIHQRIKPHKCNICGKSFSQPTPLKTHKLSQHTEIRPFNCVYCDKGFVGKNILNYHQKHCRIKQFDEMENSSKKIPEHDKRKRLANEHKGKSNLAVQPRAVITENDPKQKAIDQNQLSDLDSTNTQNLDSSENCNDETNDVPPQNHTIESSSYVVPPDLQKWPTLCQETAVEEHKDNPNLAIRPEDSKHFQKNVHCSENVPETDDVAPQNNNGESSTYLGPADLRQWWNHIFI